MDNRKPDCRRQLWLLQLLLLMVLQLPSECRATEIIVYWNASNPLFKPAGVNSLPVQLQDRLLFVCPTGGVEFYQIYWTTSAEQSRRCAGGMPLFSCRLMESYLVDVRLYSADPTAPGFSGPVYFYTPSTGDPLGMDQREGGACLSRNMRLQVAVADPDDGKAAATAASPKSSEDPRLRLPYQHSTVNNEMLLASRPSADEDRIQYQQHLNLITGSSATSADASVVAGLSLCLALLRGLLNSLT